MSDVFHTGSPDSTLWEFKHGNGSFKKGDLVGLREIKRRASRHALIHRDSFSNPKPPAAMPGGPIDVMPDTTESRLLNLEHAFYDVHARLQRSEDTNSLLSTRCQALTDSLLRCHQWTQSLASFVQSLTPSETVAHIEANNMQKEISRQLELVRALDTPHEPLSSARHTFFSSNLDGTAHSPRIPNFDDSRRSSVQLADSNRPSPGRPHLPSHITVSPRAGRYAPSIGNNASPGFSRPPLPPQQPLPPQPHPLASVIEAPGMNLARRHTSADIREHGWPIPPPPNAVPEPNPRISPYVGQNSSAWPPGPHQNRGPLGEQTLRDQLASYEINNRRQASGRVTPPPSDSSAPQPLAESVGWPLPKFSRTPLERPGFDLHSAPATRRSSMASNVHNLLNPTAETAEEDDEPMDDRKRKRLQ